MTDLTLKPGSDEAIKAGCFCPIIDNGHGRGYMGGVKDENGETLYVYTVGCPIHHPEKAQEHIRYTAGTDE